MLRAPLVMATVAGLCAISAAVILSRPVNSDAGAYGKRISATMFAAFAIILGGFAASLWSWGAR